MEGVLVNSNATILFKTYLKHREVDKKQARGLIRNLIAKKGTNIFQYVEINYVVTDTGFKYDKYDVTHKIDSLGRDRRTKKKMTSYIFNLKTKKFYVKNFTRNGFGEKTFKRLSASELDSELFNDISVRYPKLAHKIRLHRQYSLHGYHLLDDLYFNKYNGARQIINTSYSNSNPFVSGSEIHSDGYTDVINIIGNNYHKLKNLNSKTLTRIKPNQKIISTALMLGVDKIDLSDKHIRKNLIKYIRKVSVGGVSAGNDKKINPPEDVEIELDYDENLVRYINETPELSLVKSLNKTNITQISNLELSSENSVFVSFNGGYFVINFKKPKKVSDLPIGSTEYSVNVDTHCTKIRGGEKKKKVDKVCYILQKRHKNIDVCRNSGYFGLESDDLPF